MFYQRSPSCSKCARRPRLFYPLAMATRVFFFAQGCPCAEECSDQSWKKAQAWGETEDVVREQVVKHLMTSGLHKLSKADAWAMALLAAIYSYEDEEAPPSKKHASGSQASGSQSSAIGARQLQMLQPSTTSVPSPESMVRSTSVGIVPATSSGHIFMRTQEFQAAIDCVNRALNSAQQAQRVALAASRAFADEVAAFNDVKTNLEAIKATAEQM